jgi:D-lactate dehydrogenase
MKTPTTPVALFDAKSYDQTFFDLANGDGAFDIKYVPTRLGPDTAALAEGALAVCAFVNDDLSAPTIDTLYELGVRLVAMRCAGYNNVDLSASYQRMHVVRVPAYSPHAVAEHTLALMLSLNRKTHRAYYRTRDSNFAISGLLGFDMHGKTAGVIGTGQIGRLVAQILRGFGMKVVAFDVFPDHEWAEQHGVIYRTLDDIYRESDIITLHCPLMAENHHLIGTDSIARMKQGVMLINTGRGGLIDTAALIAALKTGHIGAAGLDVYEEEDQFFFEDHSDRGLADDALARLLTFPTVLVTSHQAFFTKEAMTNIATTTLSNIHDFVAGIPLLNEICYQCCGDGCSRKRTGRCF